MQSDAYLRGLLAAVCLLATVGCMRSWRPPDVAGPATQAADSQATTQPEPAPADYLRAWRRGRWTYERRDLDSGSQGLTDRYVREARGSRVSEGTLVGRPLQPLKRYLVEEAPATQPAARYRPIAPLGKAWAAFFAVDEPMDPIPVEVFQGRSVVSRTGLRYYDKLGRLVAKGTLTRTAVLEGYEDVICPAGRFERCARIRVQLTVHFPLVLTVEWDSYVWLSAEVGEIKRVQQFSGWFLVFWFGSAHEFNLESWDPPRGKPPRRLATHWTHGLINLGNTLSRPRIDGMLVDGVASRPAP